MKATSTLDFNTSIYSLTADKRGRVRFGVKNETGTDFRFEVTKTGKVNVYTRGQDVFGRYEAKIDLNDGSHVAEAAIDLLQTPAVLRYLHEAMCIAGVI